MAQADSIHSDVLVSSASVLCAVIVCGPASIFLPSRDLMASLSPMVSCYMVRSILSDSCRFVRQPIGSLPCRTDFTRFRPVLPDCVSFRMGVRRRPEGIPEMGPNSPPTSRRGVPRCVDSWRSRSASTPGYKLLTDYKLIV